MPTYSISKSFHWDGYITSKVAQVCRMFGLTVDRLRRNHINFNCQLQINDGDIVYTNLTEAGNITTDPEFTSSTDFSLQATSPCIDAGTNVGLSSDYLGNFVPINLIADIGAYEHAAVTPPATGTVFLKSGNKFLKSGSKFLVTQ